MKKLLLFIGFLASFAQVARAQSLENTTVPASAEIGGEASFTLSYVSSVTCTVEATLFLFDVDGEGVLVPNWSGWKAGTTVDNLPAVTTASAQTLTLAIPGDLVPTSELPAGKAYAWVLNLKNAGGDWLAGSQLPVTIVVSGEVTNSILFADTTPATANVGSTVTVSYSYSLVEAGIVKIALSKYVDGAWQSDVATVIVNPADATTAVTEGTADLVIPADTPLSADLADNEGYKWELSLFTPDWGSYLTGAKSDVELLETTAGINNVSLNAISVYPNPANNVLSVKGIDVQNIEVIDVTGKVLVSASTNSVNVSALSTGIYFAKINNSKAIKFIKN